LNPLVVPIVIRSEGMGDWKYLTAEEVADRYRGRSAQAACDNFEMARNAAYVPTCVSRRTRSMRP
jgi:hypothetical protein